MNQYVIGVDLSTKRIDAALIPLGTSGSVSVATMLVPATTHGDAARIREAHRAASGVFARLRSVAERDGAVALIAVEQPAAGGNPAVLAHLAPIYGAVVSAAHPDELVVGVRVNAWRSALGLSSSAPRPITADLSRSQAQTARKQWLKQQSVAEASRLLAAAGHAIPIDTHDAAEAVLIAHAARLIYTSEAEAS